MKINIKLIAIAAVVSSTSAVSAATGFDTLLKTSAGIDISAPSKIPLRARELGSGRENPAGLLGSVLTAMSDQPGTAEILAEWLRDNKAVVEARGTGLEPSAHAWLAGAVAGQKTPAVHISPAAMTPVSYRYLAILIARETGELMLASFPESAEKRYIIASRMSECFFELGGTRLEMSNIDGHADAKVEGSLRLWVENDPAGGVAVLERGGAKTLKTLEAGLAAEYERLLMHEQAIDQMLSVPNDPYAPSLQAELEQTWEEASAVRIQLEAVKLAAQQFAQFSKEESSWLWNHQGSLQ